MSHRSKEHVNDEEVIDRKIYDVCKVGESHVLGLQGCDLSAFEDSEVERTKNQDCNEPIVQESQPLLVVISPFVVSTCRCQISQSANQVDHKRNESSQNQMLLLLVVEIIDERSHEFGLQNRLWCVGKY